MKTIKNIILINLLILIPLWVLSQDLVSAKEASTLIKSKETVLVSARATSAYAKVHIPGAINISHTSLNGDIAMLKPAAEI